MIKPSLLLNTHIVKRVFGWVPKMSFLGENWDLNTKFYFSNPEKEHPCEESRLLTYYVRVKIRGRLCCNRRI